MYRPLTAALFPFMLAGALVTAACGDDDPVTGPTDEPVAITEAFSGSLSPNGGVTHQFAVQRAGEIVARFTSLSPSDAVVGLSIGPATIQGCSQTIANDRATSASALAGTATTAGSFCVRVYDAAGTLTGPISYEVTVTHF